MPFKQTTPVFIAYVVGMLLLTASCGGGPEIPNTNKARAANSNTAPAELELSGLYLVSGADENNSHPYQGTLNITNQGDAYVFTWHTNPSKPGGVGVQIGDALAASYADAANGNGCGVALYKIGTDGSL